MTIKFVQTACSLLAAAVTLGAAQRVHALPISVQYAVSVHDADPGLVLQTADIATNPYVGQLALGVPVTFDLFRIWTDEAAVNLGEDTLFKPATVQWTFATPAGVAVSGGFTRGSTFFGIFDAGQVVWGGPTVVNFANGAQIAISLSNETFNATSITSLFFDLTPGVAHGANVQATFLLTRKPTPVPEPALAALVVPAVVGLLAMRQRRRRRWSRGL